MMKQDLMTSHGGYLKKNSTSRVVFRADGNSVIGLGHIMRCISIINMLQMDFICIFICNRPSDQVKNILSINLSCDFIFIDVEKSENEIEIIKPLLKSTDIFVIDGYQFTSDYQFFIKYLVKKLVCIDDSAGIYFHADVIINHGSTKWTSLYRTNQYSKIFSGFPYLILRNEFLNAALEKKIIEKVTNIFICFGGADPLNITPMALDACLECDFIENITVITGAVYKNDNLLKSIIRSNKQKNINYIKDASVNQIINEIEDSHLAISTSSTIALEICCIKSALITGTIINNQYAIHEQLKDAGCCRSIGDWRNQKKDNIRKNIEFLSDINEANKIIQAQSYLIDGKSGERINKVFKELAL